MRCSEFRRVGIAEPGSFGEEAMARIWKEQLDPEKHRDFMSGYQDAGGIPVDVPRDNLLPQWVYFVRVASLRALANSLLVNEDGRIPHSASPEMYR